MSSRLLLALAIAAPCTLAAASAPVPIGESVDRRLATARAETQAAERRVRELESLERSARGEAQQIAAQRQRAAADLALAEARITAADADVERLQATLALRRQALARQRAPLAALLAGLVTLGQRPPILALADGASIDEVIRVRALVDTTMPVIARRSAALDRMVDRDAALAREARAARLTAEARRAELQEKREAFAALERRALDRAAQLTDGAIGAGDAMLAGAEAVLDLETEAASAAAARAIARELAPLAPLPPRPGDPAPTSKPPLAYRLPTAAPVIEGMGTVSRAGVRARGIRFATARGSAVTAPADGRVLFAGAYRDHDGLIIIDHGKGWTSVLLDVAPLVKQGAQVSVGAPLGRALGPIQLELREHGQLRSAALIAGSSDLLSNRSEPR